jgi:CheY-like chemotaxis protein
MADIAPFLPLHTRGMVVVIDDEKDFVTTFAGMHDDNLYSVAPFTEPAELHKFMAARLPVMAQHRSKIVAISRAQAEAQGTVAVEALRFFATPARFDVPLVLVSDYAMPLETGVSICSKYGDAGVQRVLLTGVADTTIAITAFNSGFIEQFLQKGPNFPYGTMTSLQRQLEISQSRLGGPLAEMLPADLTATLAHSTAKAALGELLAKLQVREYMMLGKPQGILGVTATGDAVWIQLETENSVDDLVEHIIELACVGPATLERVRRRKSLIATEWMHQIGQELVEQDSQVLSMTPLLLAATYHLQLPPEFRPAVRAEGF